MSTLAEQIHSPLMEHEAAVRKAFQLVAPDQIDLVDAVKKYGDFRPEYFVRAEQAWRELADQFRSVERQSMLALDELDSRWHGEAFDKFAKFVGNGGESGPKESIRYQAKMLADKASKVADGLHSTNELYRVTWEELSGSTASIVGALIGGAIGAVLGTEVPVVGNVVLGAIGALIGALIPIIIQSGFDAVKAEHDLSEAIDEFNKYTREEFKLPEPKLGKGGWDRDTPQIVG